MAKKSLVERILAALQEEETSVAVATKPKKHKRVVSESYMTKEQSTKLVVDWLNTNETGGTAKQINAATGVPLGTLWNRLSELGKANKVFRRKEDGITVYSLNNVKTVDDQQVVLDKNDKWSGLVIDYVAEHIGYHYALDKMGRDLGMPDGVVQQVARRLVKRGILPKNFNKGTKLAPSDEPAKPNKAAQAVEATTAADSLVSQVEFLIWTFVRETRTTDALAFLTWLEQRSK